MKLYFEITSPPTILTTSLADKELHSLETICSTNSSAVRGAFVYKDALGVTWYKYIYSASTMLVGSTVGSHVWILGPIA